MAEPVVLSAGELMTDSGSPIPSSAFTNISAIATEVAADPALTTAFQPVPTAWTNLTLINSWTLGTNARYRKIGDNVQITMGIGGGGSGTVAATLPVGHRPTVTSYFVGLSAGNGTAVCEIATNGDITISDGLSLGNVAAFAGFGTITFPTT